MLQETSNISSICGLTFPNLFEGACYLKTCSVHDFFFFFFNVLLIVFRNNLELKHSDKNDQVEWLHKMSNVPDHLWHAVSSLKHTMRGLCTSAQEQNQRPQVAVNQPRNKIRGHKHLLVSRGTRSEDTTGLVLVS